MGEAALQLTGDWKNQKWRLSNLYYIQDEHGKVVQFKPNEQQLDLIGDLWWLNIILKSRQHGFCLAPSTLVLTADLRWIRIDEIQPGQELVAVDEHPPGGRGAARKMRTAMVRATRKVVRSAYRIRFDDGRSVVCTGLHPWLSRKVGTQAKWRTIEAPTKKKLRVGTYVRWVTKPWGESSHEDGWFGGMLDGEGTMGGGDLSSVSVAITQLRGAVFDRMERYCRDRGYRYQIESDRAERPSKFGRVPVPRIALGRMDELFRLIGQCRPTRFLSRRWWVGRELPGKKTSIGWAKIVSIDPVGTKAMIDLDTTTGTFIAEGFVSHNTTLIDILGLDTAVWTSNQNIGIIAHGLREAQEIFRTKVKFPYDRLPEAVKAACSPRAETKFEFEFANGSRIAVGTSMRSGTYQMLHVSEFGKISRRYPDKAKEIVAGSFNAVHSGQHIFVESTAEGRDGWFYDMVQTAKKKRASEVKLTALDFRLHFFPWWKDKRNRLDPEGVPIPETQARYFADLQREHGIALEDAQKAWYVKKIETARDLMYAEHPSTVDEAFKAAVEGAIYGKEIALAYERKLIGKVEHIPGIPVNTYWDLGHNDINAIWFEQRVAGRHRFVRFYQNRMQGLSHYVQKLQEFQMAGGWVYGRHFLPHDAETITLASSENKDGRNTRELLEGMGVTSITVLERIHDVGVGIDMTRLIFPLCEFDAERCDEGLKALENYQYEFDDRIGTYRNHPRHDWSSNAADAFRQFGQGHHLADTKGSFKRTARPGHMAV